MELVTVSSVLDAVTVYARGAVCTRLARLVPTGATLPRTVRFGGLPLTLKEGSLRARVLSGPAGLSVTDVRAGFDAELPPEADVPAEQHALEAALDLAGGLELELSLVLRELSQIASLRPAFLPRKRGEPPREAPVGAILELAGFVDGELGALNTRRLDLTLRLTDARNEVELRRARLLEASSSKRTERARLARAAVVSLSVPDLAGEAELALEYLVPGARWTPGYELRLAKDMATGSLRLRASIAQRSGEDWKNVRLAVSTADLDRRTDVPELKSLKVGRSQPAPPRSGWREPPPGLDELFAPYDEALRRRPVAAAAAEPLGVAAPSLEPAPRDLARKPRRPPTGEFRLAASMPGAAPQAGMGGAPPPSPSMPARRAPAPASAVGARKRSALAEAEAQAVSEEGAVDELAAADGQSFGGVRDEPAPEPEAEVALGGELLDYGVLALPDAGQAEGRGRLAPRRDPLRGLLVAASLTVQVELLVATLQQGQREAGAVDGLTPPPYAVPLRQSAGSYDYRYDAAHRVDVEGDGAWHTVAIGAAEVTLEPRYVCVPSMEPRVYRTLTVRNGSSQALLAGGADVTLGNEFLMTVPFPAIGPHGEDRVGLGVEEAIKVSRNTAFNETTGGLLGGSSVLAHELQIEVANRLSHPVEVEVRERVPLSADDDIKVDEAQVEPPWKPDETVRDGAVTRGLRFWRVSLAAGAKASLSARYVIKLPSGKVLVGGNRRV
ncbi:MAG: DUF4139 domain-containing protein [Myxococcaceae bacterium]